MKAEADIPVKVKAIKEAKIVEWDDERGYGFLQVGSGRVFLYRRDFSERHKRPQVGDWIRFTVGVDAQKRTCAKEAVHVNDGGRLTLVSMVVLLGLLVLPSFAIYRTGVDWRWPGGYAAAISAISYGRYATDKRRARENKRRELAAAGDCHGRESRVSEAGLHLTEVLGGWPGAFVAQRRLRHKVSKKRYLAIYWTIVIAYQLVAFDCIMGWKYSRAVWESVGQMPGNSASVISVQQEQVKSGVAAHRN